MSKPYKVRIPIYGGTFQILFTDHFRKGARKMGFKAHNKSYTNSNGLAIGCGLDCGILLKKSCFSRWDVIAHECLHVSHFIMENVGIKPSLVNDEAQAYLLSSLVTQVMIYRDELNEKVRNRNKKKKK